MSQISALASEPILQEETEITWQRT